MKSLNTLLFYFNLYVISSINIGIVKGIIDGVPADPHQFAYQASIQVNNEHVCGGVLLDEEYVLSAASCFIGINNRFINRFYTVATGAINLFQDQNMLRVEVIRIFIPRIYVRQNISNSDIAILELRNGVNFRRSVYLPPLPRKKNSRTFLGNNIVLGYGLSITDNNDIGRDIVNICHNRCIRLRFVPLNVMENEACQELTNENIHDNLICAKMNQRNRGIGGTCYGDVGSPLISGNTIFGILIKHTDDCNETQLPAYYSRVSNFMPFITGVLDVPIRAIRLAEIRYAFYDNNNIYEI